MDTEKDKIITLRFKGMNKQDSELYQRLEMEKKRLGISMPSYVKSIIGEYFEDGKKEKGEEEILCIVRDEMEGYLRKVQEMVRDEMTSLSAVLVGTLVRMSGISTNCKENIHMEHSNDNDNNLPAYSDELPDGLEDVLSRMM